MRKLVVSEWVTLDGVFDADTMKEWFEPYDSDDRRNYIRESVMASDAFFPFRDGLDAAAQAGITAVIQPGGSIRDAEVVKAADEHGIAMILTGMRHFRH